MEFYKLPKLEFPTKPKIVKKFYKKLIVKLHPDKRRKKKTNTKLFQEYYEKCQNAMKMKCIYKLWLLTKKINIKIKSTSKIDNAFIIEINTIKQYIDTLKKSHIYNWNNCDNEEDRCKYLNNYIKENTHRI